MGPSKNERGLPADGAGPVRGGGGASAAPPTHPLPHTPRRPPQVQTWSRLGEVRATIARLEAEKGRVAQGVRALMVRHPPHPAPPTRGPPAPRSPSSVTDPFSSHRQPTTRRRQRR